MFLLQMDALFVILNGLKLYINVRLLLFVKFVHLLLMELLFIILKVLIFIELSSDKTVLNLMLSWYFYRQQRLTLDYFSFLTNPHTSPSS